MVFKNLDKGVINPHKIFEYYYATSQNIYDDIDAVTFTTEEAALKYITSNDYYPEYTLSIVRYFADDNGLIYEKLTELCRVPSKKKRTAKYYILGVVDDEAIVPRQLMCFPYWYTPTTEVFNSRIIDCTSDEENVNMYLVTVTLTDDNRLEYQYEIVSKIKENGVHKLVK